MTIDYWPWPVLSHLSITSLTVQKAALSGDNLGTTNERKVGRKKTKTGAEFLSIVLFDDTLGQKKFYLLPRFGTKLADQ